MGKLLLGVLLGIVLVAIAGLAFALSFNTAATQRPGALERLVAGVLVEHSAEKYAPKQQNPLKPTPEVLARGLDHYRENCLGCHAAPGVTPSEIARGMNPSPPDLASDDTQKSEDGELFWIIRDGIRMTGMPAFGPTHTPEELWATLAFVRHLPKLTEAERAALRKTGEGEEEHHREGGEAAPKPSTGGQHPPTPSHP